MTRNRTCSECQAISPPPHKILIFIAKGKIVNLQWINLIGTTASKWSKFVSRGMRCTNFMWPWPDSRRMGGHNVPSVVFVPKTQNLSLIMEKHQVHPKWRIFYRTMGQKYCNHERQRLEETKETWSTKCEILGWTVSEQKKVCWWDSGKSWNEGWKEVNSVVSVFVSWCWSWYCSYIRCRWGS